MTRTRMTVIWLALIAGGFLTLVGFFASAVAVWLFLGTGAAVVWLCGLVGVAAVALSAADRQAHEDEESGAPEGAYPLK